MLFLMIVCEGLQPKVGLQPYVTQNGPKFSYTDTTFNRLTPMRLCAVNAVLNWSSFSSQK